MASRRQERESALKILFSWDMSGEDIKDIIDKISRHFENIPANSYAEYLCLGVTQNIKKIDSLLSSFSRHWKVGRMGIVERNILRIAVFEIKFMEDLPNNVTINEAIEISKIYGDKESPMFINGILDAIAKS